MREGEREREGGELEYASMRNCLTKLDKCINSVDSNGKIMVSYYIPYNMSVYR